MSSKYFQPSVRHKHWRHSQSADRRVRCDNNRGTSSPPGATLSLSGLRTGLVILVLQEFNISDIKIHPNFNNATLVNDIALLKLERPAKRQQNIDVVCVANTEDIEESRLSNCYVTGWGRRTESSEHSTVLKEITVPLWEQSVCNSALQDQFGPGYSLPSSSVCAGAEGRDACDGDGGGPLVCQQEGQWYQVGIVSFGIGCGRAGVPGVYTRVSHFYPWLETTILSSKKRRRAL